MQYTGMQAKAANIIREELERTEIRVVRIILFGSRATSDFTEDSDWDFLVVVDKELARKEKWDIILKIKRRLAKLKIPNDIIMNSEKQIQERKNDVGYTTYYALKEGIEV